MELRDYLRTLQQNWALIAIALGLGALVGVGGTLVTPPTYEATAQLYVSVRSTGQASGELVQGSTFARQNVQSYASIVTTESVLAPVANELGADETAASLASRVTAGAPVNTSLVSIAATDTDPGRAAEIANRVAVSFTRLVEQDLEASDSAGASPVKLTTVQPATVPEQPKSPRLLVNLALGLLIGLAVGVGAAILRGALDTRIRGARDLEQLTDTPFLGGIVFDREAIRYPIAVHSDPRGIRAESFRTLRTSVQFLAAGETSESRGRSFVISSATSAEGKTTTAVNLAIALAEAQLRVLLIDGDLRRPRVAEYLGIEGGAGLTDILIGRAEPSEVLQRWGRTQLFALPAGRIPPNPSELLGSSAMTELMKAFHQHFDFILVDAPPLLPVTDAAVIGTHTDGVVLVAAAGTTRKPQFEATVQSLRVAGLTPSGVVLTMLPARGAYGEKYGAAETDAPVEANVAETADGSVSYREQTLRGKM